MTCLECGNCKEGKKVFFCPARNEFEIREETVVREKENSRWKKGDPAMNSTAVAYGRTAKT